MLRRHSDILDAIKAIHSEKQGRDIVPDYATTIEIARRTGLPLSEAREAVRELAKAGILKVGMTISYEYCETIDKK